MYGILTSAVNEDHPYGYPKNQKIYRKGGKLNEKQVNKKELMYSSGDSYASGLVGHQCKCMFMFL
jgi:hypothetical protein